MAARFEVSQLIDRPVDKVFDFFARQHVRNHPRWDPDIELWLDSDVPLQVAEHSLGLPVTIRRRSS